MNDFKFKEVNEGRRLSSHRNHNHLWFYNQFFGKLPKCLFGWNSEFGQEILKCGFRRVVNDNASLNFHLKQPQNILINNSGLNDVLLWIKFNHHKLKKKNFSIILWFSPYVLSHIFYFHKIWTKILHPQNLLSCHVS